MKSRLYLTIGLVLALFVTTPGLGESATERSFNVVTYNVRLNTPSDGTNAWPHRRDKVIGLIRFHQAEIFGVQEALPEQISDLKSGFPDFGSYGVGRDDGKDGGECMAIFFRASRFTRLDAGTFWLSETPEKPGLGWDARHNRTCTWMKLRDQLSGRDFYHFNTHFDHIGKIAKAESAKLVLKYIAEINKDSLPLLLTGDFNSIKKSAPIQTLLTALSDARDTSLTTPYGMQGTSGGFEVGMKTNVIDYIFIARNVAVLRHGVLSDSFGLFYPSDHLPVLAEVRLE